MKIEGKVAAITGGARGIGLATAKAFLAAGAKVAVGDLDVELAEKAAAELGSERCIGLPLDVADHGSFADFLSAVQDRHDRMDILVNNAGIMPTGLFLDESPAMTDRIIAINVRGVVTGSRLAAQRFCAQGGGHIVNVASLAGITGEPGLATYCGSKHFVVGFTESLHRELDPHGIGVSMVLPGVINTELSRGTQVPAWAKSIATAEPEDVAAAIVAAVADEKVRVTVPKALGALLKTMSVLPARARFAVAHAARFDQLASGADPEARARYHRRIAEQQQ
ncbi:SDR family oxidoreductase [Mycobacterium sp. pUA109]|uniref:SDR family oxidoreductase n=1 Tax=Mycobacterium sp. pUA109 TaxID=3238982 RepID=UPI00351AFF4B